MTQNQDLERSIDQKRTELIALNSDVDIWQANVANTENFRTRYQKTLEDIQHRQFMTSDELHALEMNRPKPTMAIYNMTDLKHLSGFYGLPLSLCRLWSSCY